MGTRTNDAVYAKHSVSVAGVVVNSDDCVLAMRRDDNGRWEAPGGVLELGETFEEGVRREVFEETKAVVQVERLTGVYKNLARGVVALVFRCAYLGGQIESTAEAQEVRWMTRTEVIKEMVPAFAVRILDAFDNETHFRAHDGVDLVER